MAVQYVDLLFSSGIKTSVDDKGWTTATAQLRFNVFVSSPEDNEAIVKLSPLIPYEKSRHPYFGGLRCIGIDISRSGPLHFEVSADYSSPPYKDEDQQEQGPLAQPTQINYFTITSEEPIEDALNGRPIATKVGEPIEGVTRPISDLGIRLQKNFATFDPSSFYTYIDCVNSDTFLGFSPGVLRIASITADEQFFTDENDNEIPYWSVSVEIHARKPYRVPAAKAWYKRVRHEGYYIKVDNQNGKIQYARATDENGVPVTKPVLLNSDGTRKDIPEDDFDVEADWRLFEVFEQVSFSSMGF